MTWLLLVPLFPLAAALCAPWAGRAAPGGSGWAASAGMAGSVLALLALSGVWQGAPLEGFVTWLSVGALRLTVGLQLDGLSWWVGLVVASVCLLVTLYAVAYMREDDGRARFFTLMAFFGAAMLTLVLARSFVLLFMAWEGVGLASFGLIGFWFQEEAPPRAAQKAFLMTRLGDFGLLLGWLLALLLTESTSIAAFNEAAAGGALAGPTLTLLALLFFAAAVGKSAQLPLTAWLPDAMAGPTPVSALLHSATMVAAGVYLVLRLFPLFEAAPFALTVVLWTGAATALVAALVATAQYDLKRLLAWSTVSQLGEMMMALGLGGPIAAAFHLTTHAVFKSTLFLTAGAVDHAAGSRDLRALGSLWRTMPLIAGIFGVSALALAGFPPFAGFWSEEAILGAAQARGAGWGLLMLLLIFLAGMYIGRAGWAAFGRWPDAPAPEGKRPARLMLAPMLLLTLAAAALGFLIKTPNEHVLPFAAEPHSLGLWRWAAIAASAAGLGLGAGRVWAAGPVPALGSLADAFATALHAATRSAARGAALVAASLRPVERGVDALAAGLARTVQAAAGGTGGAEHGLDAGARRAVSATQRSAGATDAAERRGFGDSFDAFGYAFRRAGRRLRALESGKLYLYTFSVFVWVLLVGAAVLLWL